MDNQEEKSEYLLYGQQGEFYANLLDTYSEFMFKNEEEENEFIKQIKFILDDNMAFETKIHIIRGITMDVVLHKTIDNNTYVKYYSKKPE